MYQTILTSLENGIFTITINRPDKLNALNAMVLTELEQAVDEIYNNPEIRSAIITGAGPKAFVAGADISEFVGLDKEAAMILAKRGQDIYFKIENSKKPIVAAVNGFALGGGCELAMACHIRLASDNARFGQPEVKLGIPPGYGGTIRLGRLIGKGRALEMLTTGGMIDAKEADRIGLVNRVYPADQLMAEAEKLARAILANAPLAVAACIDLANLSETMSMDDALTLETTMFGVLFETADAAEGARAFVEKRPPLFEGK